jgi:hypothetical protein
MLICVILVLFASIFLINCPIQSDQDNSNISQNPSEPFDPSKPSDPSSPDIKYTKEFWGEWIRMDTGDTWYFTSTGLEISGIPSTKSITLSKQSDRVLEITEGSRKYYLYASRVARSSFKGRLANIQGIQRAAGGGIGGIGLIINNLKDKAQELTATTDNDGNFTANGIIPGDDYTVTVDSQTTTVTPHVDGDNVGTITVTEGVNFKTSMRVNSSKIDMMRIYTLDTYEFCITIENTGTEDCTAATCFFELDEGLSMSNGSTSGYAQIGTLEPGKKIDVLLTLSCEPFNSEFEFKTIKITITDNILKKSWDDSVSIRFNKAPVIFNIQSNKSVKGVIIAQNAKTYPFSTVSHFDQMKMQYTDYSSSSLLLPWSIDDYVVVLSGATADTESVYSIGINILPDNNFNHLIDLGNYEPNNGENTATNIMQQEIMSYLHKNDIDFYRINLSQFDLEYKTISITDYTYRIANGSFDFDIIHPSDHCFLYLDFVNNAQAMLNAEVKLFTSNKYVEIDPNYNNLRINNLTPGESDSITFIFDVLNNCPIGEIIPFRVSFTDSLGNVCSDTIYITVQ